MQKRHRTITRALAPLAAFTLVAAACGDDDDDNGADDAATATTADAATEDTAEDDMAETEDTAEDDMAEEDMAEDDMAETEDTTEDDMAEGDGDTIVDLAAATPELSTLVTAVDTAGLVETLSGEGPFTVFAPTNDAFDAALDDLGTSLDEFLADPDLLTEVLTYHVVEGEVLSSDITAGMTATTLEGGELTFETEDGVTVNGFAVVTPDVEASNGVVHIIDGVLFP